MFIDEFQKFIKKLESGVELDEWYLTDFIDENIIKLSPSEAFELTSYVIGFIKNNIDSSCLYEFLYILLALQRQSETVEKPLVLISSPDFFEIIINKNSEDYIMSVVDELKNIYY